MYLMFVFLHIDMADTNKMNLPKGLSLVFCCFFLQMVTICLQLLQLIICSQLFYIIEIRIEKRKSTVL